MDGKDMACNCVRVYHAGQDIPAASHGLVDRLARLTKKHQAHPFNPRLFTVCYFCSIQLTDISIGEV